MYLNDYLKIAKSYILFTCSLMAIGAFCAYLSTSHIRTGYKAEQTVFVKIEAVGTPPLSSPDAQVITDTVVAYISSVDFQRAVNENTSASAKKVAAQVVTLTATAQEPALAQNALENTTKTFNSLSGGLIKTAKVELQNVGTQAHPVKNTLNNRILVLFGAIIGLASAVLIISASRYFKL